MKSILLFTGLLSFMALQSVIASETTAAGTVNTDKLMVRAGPGKEFTAISELKKGTIVKVMGVNGEWLKIAAPPDSEIWIPKSSVNENTVVKSVRLYSGPGIGKTPVGQIEKGTKVKISDSSKEGWLKIATPENTVAWVSAEFIDFTDAQQAKLKAFEQPDKSVPQKQETAVKTQAPSVAATKTVQPGVVPPPVAEPKAETEKSKTVATTEPKAAQPGVVPPAATEPAAKQPTITAPVVGAPPTTPQPAIVAPAAPEKATKPQPTATVKTPVGKPLVPVALSDEYADVNDEITVVVKDTPIIYEKGTERKIRRKGYLLPLINPVYVTHALGYEDPNTLRIVPVTYVHCKGFDFNDMQSRRKVIILEGTEHKVKGWSLPVLEVDRVIEDGKLVYQVPR
jgi:uncharacterized protein YgiM (DUF1202 family)